MQSRYERAYGRVRKDRVSRFKEVCLPGGPRLGKLSVSWYYALILNTRHVVFIDVDAAPRRAGILDVHPGPWLGRPNPEPDEEGMALERFLREEPECGFRLYRTCAGYRYLCLTQAWDPSADETEGTLNLLRADRDYIGLCKAQKNYRARLTAKPWRVPELNCDLAKFRGTLVLDQDEYNRHAGRYAACRFLREVGRIPKSLPPKAQYLIELHDRLSKAHEPLPLA